jgi:hypothetical protein
MLVSQRHAVRCLVIAGQTQTFMVLDTWQLNQYGVPAYGDPSCEDHIVLLLARRKSI